MSETVLTDTRGERRWWVLFTLIVAGETVFVLPFVVARVFRPTLLQVFELSNLQLGTAFSAYGMVAMLSYLFGGPLADRYAARGLISVALLATAAGGALFATIPSAPTLTALYAFWGLTSIFLFWAALIRATREWGGANAQGRAFGWLDGGRGLLAALLASVLVGLFAQLLPAHAASASPADRMAALQQVILVCTGLTLVAGAMAWTLLPATRPVEPASESLNWSGLSHVARLPAIWLQAMIVVCAYVGYKATDNFGLYAVDVLGYDEVEAAWLGTLSFWMRPIAAIATGLVADRIDSSRALVAGFALAIIGSGTLAAGVLPAGLPSLLVLTVVTASLGVYAVRAVYYAIMQEARIPLAVTGAAVGLVSVIGYTPDVFAGPLFGYLLDRAPGAPGHQQVFAVVAGFAVLGLLTALAFRSVCVNPAAPAPGSACDRSAWPDRGRG